VGGPRRGAGGEVPSRRERDCLRAGLLRSSGREQSGGGAALEAVAGVERSVPLDCLKASADGGWRLAVTKNGSHSILIYMCGARASQPRQMGFICQI